MIEITDKSKCCGCEACKNICPKNCITMKEDEEGFRYPHIDKDKCINCGLCEKVCQYILNNEKRLADKIYACVKKDIDSLGNSSTVALFYELGRNVIENNGFVFGAIYDENMEVKHSIAEKIEDLEKMRSSKYVQSKMDDVYTKVEKLLKEEKLVMFSGTPCQVGGLYKFLRKGYDNLITIDIICHSVPSPKIYKDYLKRLEKRYNSKIKNINFRKKYNGWLNPYTEIEFEDENIKYLKPSTEDEWYRIFISHYTTRPSCNNCLYTSVGRISDITLGDFWGIDKIKPQIDNYHGVGKIMLNTDKGKNFFEKIKEKYDIYEMTVEDSIRPNLLHPPKKHPKREEFFEFYKRKGYIKTYKKFLKRKWYKKVKNKIKFFLERKSIK